MASAFAHVAVAYALGKSLSAQFHTSRFWWFTMACCLLPDADVLGLVIGIPYEHMLGHRGLTHSIVFAMLLGWVVPRLAAPTIRYGTRRYWLFAVYFFLVTLSHGFLDALTNGGLGIAFFAPFDSTRYFFPFRPVAVSPIGISVFISHEGFRVLLSELVWIGIPVGIWLLCVAVMRKAGRKGVQ
ncbi:metal-dependent hydrolase [Candidatus Nitrospira allomarina]|uniref:Metal-dependent hydrolase n=1 Tax=Candidatus Nitrospira allomarina TaxID=3020900 RepID=A0AA96GL54_9BACT|nr:metal-dependent hydrolase [Candidatus Nitrospira allomarina]WNM59561.1 metal-dependent hydrolase [Candidatus Nitrospira allomarina]